MEKMKNLLQKLNDFRQIVGNVKKNATNPFHKSKYATLESVLDTIEEPLNKSGIGYHQIIKLNEGCYYLVTTIYDLENTTDILDSWIPLLFVSDMQKLGSAITYARRYGLVSILGLEQEDDDANLTLQTQLYKKEDVKNTNQKIIKLTDIPDKKGKDAGKTWSELLDDVSKLQRLNSYKSWWQKEKNVEIVLDNDFQKLVDDMEVGL